MMEPTGIAIVLTFLIAMAFCVLMFVCANCLHGVCRGLFKPWVSGRSSQVSSNNSSGSSVQIIKRASFLEML